MKYKSFDHSKSSPFDMLSKGVLSDRVTRCTSYILYFLILNCSENPVFKNRDIEMFVAPEATEAWIDLHIDGLKSNATYVVKRGDSTVFEGKITSADTSINDTGLNPLTSYTYKSYAKASGEKSPKESQTITTMDTTSHEISWERLEWGDVGSSYFRDVHIINENDIWAVGELFIWHEDSVDYTKYNAVHWDGVGWELKRPANIYKI